MPEWLRPLLHVAAGDGTSFCREPEQAFVYVEEGDTGLRTGDVWSPFHVVRCGPLPALVRFVEVPSERLGRGVLRCVSQHA
jgi:hypothetical protein